MPTNQTRKQRVTRMLRQPHKRLTRQLGKRNLFNTRRANNVHRLSNMNTNTNRNTNRNTNSLSGSFSNLNEPRNLARIPGLSNQEQRNLNEYQRNLQKRHNNEGAYRQRKTMTGAYNRFKQRQENRRHAKQSAALQQFYNQL